MVLVCFACALILIILGVLFFPAAFQIRQQAVFAHPPRRDPTLAKYTPKIESGFAKNTIALLVLTQSLPRLPRAQSWFDEIWSAGHLRKKYHPREVAIDIFLATTLDLGERGGKTASMQIL